MAHARSLDRLKMVPKMAFLEHLNTTPEMALLESLKKALLERLNGAWNAPGMAPEARLKRRCKWLLERPRYAH